MDQKSAPPLDKETGARLDDQISTFKAGTWKAVLDELELDFVKKEKRTIPIDEPNSCGFEVVEDGNGKSIFKIVFGFVKYWPSERYDHWHVRLSIRTEIPGTRTGGYENRYLQDELPAISERAVLGFIKNLFPVMMILKD